MLMIVHIYIYYGPGPHWGGLAKSIVRYLLAIEFSRLFLDEIVVLH